MDEFIATQKIPLRHSCVQNSCVQKFKLGLIIYCMFQPPGSLTKGLSSPDIGNDHSSLLFVGWSPPRCMSFPVLLLTKNKPLYSGTTFCKLKHSFNYFTRSHFAFKQPWESIQCRQTDVLSDHMSGLSEVIVHVPSGICAVLHCPFAQSFMKIMFLVTLISL